MTQQYTPNLGNLANDGARRDAVHVAVAPVVAAHSLPPGHHVGLNADGHAIALSNNRRTAETIGIVDPFLGHLVDKGECFWLFLYPNTVISLRHVWSHPSFISKVPL